MTPEWSGMAKKELASELERALAKNKAAKATWDRFAPSHKKEYINWITEAKKEETRLRRIEKAVAMIAEGTPPK